MINGDNPKSSWEKIVYFYQCIKYGTKGNARSARIKRVRLKQYEGHEDVGTPSRKLSNLFWASLNWKSLTGQLNSKVNILDLGCGKGHYSYRYKKLLDENFKSYTGIDIYKHDQFPSEFTHILDKAENAYQHIDGQNLIVSQSALEHIEHDQETLKTITKKLSEKGNPFIQIHLVPASVALFLYLWHGWRQYSKKNLGIISEQLISSFGVNVQIVPLGGWRCFFTHFKNITIPNLFRRAFKFKLKYDWDIKDSKTTNKINESVNAELHVSERLPTFWALVIATKNINLSHILNFED
jgi:hypothetical protein